MRCVTAIVLALLGGASSAVEAAAEPLKTLAREAESLASDGDRYVAFGTRGAGVLHVLDTRGDRRTRVPIPRDCRLTGGDRALGGGQALLSCADGARYLRLSLRTGGALVLQAPDVSSYGYIGRHWIEAYGRTGCQGPATHAVFLNWRTGARRELCQRFDDEVERDLDDPELRGVCPSAVHQTFTGNYQRYYDGSLLARQVSRGLRDPLVAVRCGRRAVTIDRRGGDPFVANGLVTWVRDGYFAYAYEVDARIRRRWRVPGVSRRNRDLYDKQLDVMHTREQVIVSRATRQVCDRVCHVSAFRIYRAGLRR